MHSPRAGPTFQAIYYSQWNILRVQRQHQSQQFHPLRNPIASLTKHTPPPWGVPIFQASEHISYMQPFMKPRAKFLLTNQEDFLSRRRQEMNIFSCYMIMTPTSFMPKLCHLEQQNPLLLLMQRHMQFLSKLDLDPNYKDSIMRPLHSSNNS
jgi:hypothetical protein